MKRDTYNTIPKIPLCVIGNGGHSKVIADIVQAHGLFRIAAVADDKFAELALHEGVYYGPPRVIRGMLGVELEMMVVIAIGDNRIRKQMAEYLDIAAERYAVLIHPSAILSPHVTIGAGTVVMPGAIINHGAAIGKHAIVNSGAIVEHDSCLGDFAHLSPGAALAGGVCVMEGAHVGIGAAVIPRVQIGRWSILGAGGTAIDDIPDGETAVGVPARLINGLVRIIK
ncbi:acetyltransferase [Paenibacillus sp. GCM10027626]|uniref:acetyltransferase n=1 Tax=Paenibacillus sp. GCM10027626 TaxID=3273411 RepID=UPI00364332BB